MYVESNKPDSEYAYHVKKYGHPSKFGYKDFIPMWKAENFDADAWLTLFKEAGAKYFTPCAVHHDGFDLWDSKYQRFNAVVDKLIDIVSKNGNLLLNVPPKADGTFDKATVDLLRGIGKWMKVNGEGIYNTRPWLVFGEGPDTQMDSNSNKSPYTAENIRFTRSKDGRSIYVIALGWPDESMTVKSLAKGGMLAGEIKSVRLPGRSGKVSWTRSEQGLLIDMPSKKPCEHAFVWKISVKP